MLVRAIRLRLIVFRLAFLFMGITGAENRAWNQPTNPEQTVTRALAYLETEVPAWRSENGCFSCHNNGDGARALIEARRRGRMVAEPALAETKTWLRSPQWWEKPDSDGRQDKALATLQFATALRSAVTADEIQDRSPLLEAARQLVHIQDSDGSFHADGPDGLGGPTTYGRALATLLASQVLADADADRFEPAIVRARAWLLDREVRQTETAAVIRIWNREMPRKLALPGKFEQEATLWLKQAQGRDGGWGPFATSPSEAFDTALALLALAEEPDLRPIVQKGRDFLARLQFDDGSWPETTRPPNGDSYAQRVSTTAWASLAMMATEPDEKVRAPRQRELTPPSTRPEAR